MRNRQAYPDNWYDEIRPSILARDKYKCTDCGIRHRQWVARMPDKRIIKIEASEKGDYNIPYHKAYMIRLHVCHEDNNKNNCDYSNLKSRCVSCHAKKDGAYKQLIRKGGTNKKQLDLVEEIGKLEETQAGTQLRIT